MTTQTERPWRLRLIGDFELVDPDGERRWPLYDRKQDQLLAYIALEPDAVHLRRDIVAVLWPEHSASDGRNRLTEVLFRLRRDLDRAGLPPDQAIRADTHSLRLTNTVLTDVARVEELLTQAGASDASPEVRQSLLEEADELYGEGILPSIHADWVARRREQLELRLQRTPAKVAAPAHGRAPADRSSDSTLLHRVDHRLRESTMQYVRQCVDLAELAEAQLHTRERGKWAQEFEASFARFDTAAEWALEHDETHLAARLVGALWAYWFHLGKLSSGRVMLERVIAARPDGTTPADAKVWHGAGALAVGDADLDRARIYLDRAVGLWRANDNHIGLARALTNLAIVEYRAERFDAARSYNSQAIGILKQVAPDSPHLPETLRNAALVEREAGNLADARRMMVELIRVAGARDDALLESKATIDLLSVVQGQDDWAVAEELGERALALATQLGDNRQIAAAKLAHAYTLKSQGEYDAARGLYKEALYLSQILSNTWTVAEALRCLGDLAAELGDRAEAQQQYGAALQLMESAGDVTGQKQVRGALAELGGV